MAANPTTTEVLTIPTKDIEPEPSTSKDTTPASRPEDQRGTRLYVGNLDHSVDDQNTHATYSNSGAGPHRRHAAPPKHTTLSLMKTQNKLQKRERTSKEADALLSEVLGPPTSTPLSLPAKPPPSIVPASTQSVQSVPRRHPEPTGQPGPLLNLGIIPPSIKNAASRPPALSSHVKEKPGKLHCRRRLVLCGRNEIVGQL
ncbi:RNA recognition motif domain-containing protein [Rhizoctonia solani]|uniref:RNA recognition motif domain-containing protein n=1 Tax=Rhizoctonia solani TaxID=456999 RepID=A0A8H8NWU0_9AGAM|nr:RNA recognition motif domain-containing protein [Rhizoctonia solani]QRW20855.1 RNA recognition motif domain-containing protein [Rhizoctonia solani]